MSKKRCIIITVLAFLFSIIGINNIAFAYNVEGSGICNCNSCADCMSSFSDNNCANKVKLTADIAQAGNCFSYPPGNNRIFDGQNHTITGDGTGVAIYFSGVYGWTVKNVNFATWQTGIRNYGNHQNVTIQNNTFTNIAGGLGAIFFRDDNSNSIISNNTITTANQGINVSGTSTATIVSNNIITDSSQFGIVISANGGVQVRDNTLTNVARHGSGTGIQVAANTTNATVDSNIVHGFFSGMLINGANNTVTDNTSYDNSEGGIYTEMSGGTISGNDLDNLDFSGYPNFGQNILVDNNTIGRLELKGGDNNTITSNSIGCLLMGEYDSGTSNGPSSNGNIISNNTFDATTDYFTNYCVHYQIKFISDSSSSYGMSNNTISSNNFINNSSLAIDLYNATNNIIENNNATSTPGFVFGAGTSNNKGCGNTATITNSGTNNHVSSTSQSCYVWDCETLNNTGRLASNGTYLLGQAITNHSGSCVSIAANNLTLNCQDNAIDGNGTGTGISFNTVSNATLQNCALTDFANQYNLDNATNINLNGFTYSNASSTADINISDNLIDISYSSATSTLAGLTLSNIDRALRIKVNNIISALITPLSNLATLVIDTWDTLINYYKKWTESSASHSTTVEHTIGNLATNTSYNIKVGGTNIQTVQSDSQGQLTFNYTGGYSDKIFEIEDVPPTISGLTNDTTPRKAKTWTWSSEDNANFRYIIDTNASSTISSEYATTTTATQSSGNGTYYLHVQSKDAANNESEIITVSAILDNIPPVITVSGDNPVTVAQGSTYADSGATATDNIDSSVTVTTSGSVDTATLGDYTLTYNATDVAGNAATSATRLVHVTDQATPTISAVNASASQTTATITWTTNEAASSKVEYGLTGSYGNTTDETDTTTRVTSHSVALTGLTSCKTYHYRVKSKNAANNEGTGNDSTFTTTGCNSGSTGGGWANPIRYAPITPTTTTPTTTTTTANAETQKRIELLKQLIVLLQQQLQNQTGTQQNITQETTKPAAIFSCAEITKTLSYGMSGAEVKCLQEVLKTQGPAIYPYEATGYYLNGTKLAVKKFQEKYPNEILKPFNLRYGNGVVGINTRKIINQILAGQTIPAN